MQQLMERLDNPVAKLEANVADGGYLFRTYGSSHMPDDGPRHSVEEWGSVKPDGSAELVIADRAVRVDIGPDYEGDPQDVLYTGLKLVGAKRGWLKRLVKTGYKGIDTGDIVVFEDEEGAIIKTMTKVKCTATDRLYPTWD